MRSARVPRTQAAVHRAAMGLVVLFVCSDARAESTASSLDLSEASQRALADSVHARTGTTLGVHEPELLDGGFRGTIRIVPATPAGKDARHLTWVADALFDFDDFFASVAARAPAGTTAPSYRWHDLSLLFFRSVDRTTPSAFASDWTVAYNVRGSLNTGADAVRETLFHEIFHLNDGAHRDWSARVLARDYAAILEKCGRDVACLAPYAPGDTKVRGGTYYAFQGNNGVTVREYGAELALRWYREHRALVRGVHGPAAHFKCGPPENARAWRAIVDEFFHVDLIPPCR